MQSGRAYQSVAFRGLACGLYHWNSTSTHSARLTRSRIDRWHLGAFFVIWVREQCSRRAQASEGHRLAMSSARASKDIACSAHQWWSKGIRNDVPSNIGKRQSAFALGATSPKRLRLDQYYRSARVSTQTAHRGPSRALNIRLGSSSDSPEHPCKSKPRSRRAR